MNSLNQEIFNANIQLDAKICLLKSCLLPVLLFGADTWMLMVALEEKLDAFQQWYLRRILLLQYTVHFTDIEVFR